MPRASSKAGRAGEIQPKAGRTRAAAQARREQAAILIASGLPVAEIAKLLGVREGTVRDLGLEPAVRAMIDAERQRQAARLRGSVDRALDELRTAAPKAARRLAAIAIGGAPRHAVRASVAILDRTIPKAQGENPRGRQVARDVLNDATDDELWTAFDEVRAAADRDRALREEGLRLLEADAAGEVIEGEIDDDDE